MRIRPRAAAGAAAVVLALASTRLTGAPAGAVPRPFALTVDSIMRGPALVGLPPSGLRWSGDSARLYFEWQRPGEDEPGTWVVSRAGGEPRKLSDADRRNAPPATGGVWDDAHRRVLFVSEGDIVLVDTVTGSRRAITRTTADESNPRWARHETAVTYRSENNLFLVPLDTGSVEQLTDIQPRKRDPRETDSQKYLKDEERSLIEHTRTQADKKKKEEDRKKAHALPRYELAERQTVSDLQLAPDGTHVYFLVTERAETARRAEVPNYVTDSAYAEDIPARIKVGEAQDKRTLVVMNLETGVAKPVAAGFAGEKRAVRWSMPLLSADHGYAVANVRAEDNKDRWLVRIDADSGATTVVDALHDDAWIREPGGGPASSERGFGWMPDGTHVWFLSERDGWMHLYTVDASAPHAVARQLTSGRWEVHDASLAPDRRSFVLMTSEVHPGERHLYSLGLDGGSKTRLTAMTGSNEGQLSPDGRTFALIHSYSNTPPEVYFMANAASAPARQVTTTPTEEWRSFKWADPKLITFTARDGAEVYARLYTPEMMGAHRDPAAPGVVFVHGAGYAQNAHKYWASYYREYMFHNLLASRGYVVLDADYRASSGYGRDWRTAIYRHMGGTDLQDVVDGAKYLVDHEKVNPRHIGVYGGSYGGFITLMAMFTSPDTFAAGAALRPVTDWAHYNHPYTSNILNEPQHDADAYRQSSPIYFASGLKGALLICHGMVDTNVFFQDTVRLVQRLIELRKENWQLAVFPVENHGFEEAASWADEYKRILKLFEDNLRTRHASAATH